MSLCVGNDNYVQQAQIYYERGWLTMPAKKKAKKKVAPKKKVAKKKKK